MSTAQRIYDYLLANGPARASVIRGALSLPYELVKKRLAYDRGISIRVVGKGSREHLKGAKPNLYEALPGCRPADERRGRPRRKAREESVEAVERQLLAIEAQQRRKRGLAA